MLILLAKLRSTPGAQITSRMCQLGLGGLAAKTTCTIVTSCVERVEEQGLGGQVKVVVFVFQEVRVLEFTWCQDVGSVDGLVKIIAISGVFFKIRMIRGRFFVIAIIIQLIV